MVEVSLLKFFITCTLSMAWWCILLAIGLGACGTTIPLTVRGGMIDSANVLQLNNILRDTEVELLMRGDVPVVRSLPSGSSVVLTASTIVAITGDDTVAIPLAYIRTIRGTHARTTGRLLIGATGGLLIGTVLGTALSFSTPLTLGLSGAIVGFTGAALTGQKVILHLEHQ